jgi:hypothetical protein
MFLHRAGQLENLISRPPSHSGSIFYDSLCCARPVPAISPVRFLSTVGNQAHTHALSLAGWPLGETVLANEVISSRHHLAFMRNSTLCRRLGATDGARVHLEIFVGSLKLPLTPAPWVYRAVICIDEGVYKQLVHLTGK